MAFYEKYTPVLANLMAMFVPNYDEASYQEIIETGLPRIFNFNYPIWDESYRKVLETKIVKHYYDREICCETPDLFIFYLDTKLNEIMPYYNELYASTILDFDPLINYKEEETYNRTSKENRDESLDSTTDKNNTRDTSNTDATSTLFSDTPQAVLNNLDYATSLSKVTDTTTGKITDTGIDSFNSNFNQTINNTDAWIRNKTGNLGSNYSEMVLKFRETIINIDMMIIKDLSELFMTIY